MRTRIISAAVGLIILAAALLGYYTIIFNLALSVISAIGVAELLKAFGYNKTHKTLNVIGIVFAACVPFVKTQWYSVPIIFLIFVYIIVMLGILLKQHNKIRLEEVAVAFMMSISISLSLSSLLIIREQYANYGYSAIFYTLLALGAAWLADTGAYFCGRFFGKHKLAPTVSPKKTVEGSIGGIITNIICFILLGALYSAILGEYSVNYLNLAIIGLLSAPVGMMGDLVFSVIKRQNNVKDFGTIMPGHGGVLDRFDSVILTAPFIMLVIRIIPPLAI